MPNWVTVSSFATAGGTLVLAVATFASVRSANQAARTSERALQVNLRPVLFPSRPQDPPLKVSWADRHWTSVGGGRASVELVEDVIYLSMSLRNVGSGIAVIHAWWVTEKWQLADVGHADPERFRMQNRDLYIPAGDISFWQGRLERPAGGVYDDIAARINEREPFSIELLYGDHEGGQRTISRFGVMPPMDGDDTSWICTVVRHWNLDRPDPR